MNFMDWKSIASVCACMRWGFSLEYIDPIWKKYFWWLSVFRRFISWCFETSKNQFFLEYVVKPKNNTPIHKQPRSPIIFCQSSPFFPSTCGKMNVAIWLVYSCHDILIRCNISCIFPYFWFWREEWITYFALCRCWGKWNFMKIFGSKSWIQLN